ncbi:branched-chain amino acid ABC transporter permease [Enterovirga aerilata]|uniref:Branched-chain amino acid ABC transporter permease n=1 Tax=Enterovirga aerilata TaxID=2730920 RepID=A0A849I5X0_9HYPH|nr:branched-chain amino acid ABC transporter permease [Enterovirga sp. DB1703]NNM72778.1 branched-chain amino acid ABC transporter permease [Enterovirga sp. DB1703]
MSQLVFDLVLRTGDVALVAVALSAAYSLVRFPNIATVYYATIGPFLTYVLARVGLAFWLAAALATVAVGVLAVVLNATVFDRLLRSGSAIAMIGSLAVGMLVTAVLLVTAGPDSMRFAFALSPPQDLLGARVTALQLWSMGLSSAALLGFALILFFTDIGRCMRATAANADLARATGIDAHGVIRVITFASGVLAALGGICLSLKGELNILMGPDLILPVFAAAILGGLGNPLGAILGAAVIALTEVIAASTNFGPLLGQAFLFLPVNYIGATSFAILVLALLFRPYGLFVNEVRRV